MNVLIDIIHPAHLNLFKGVINRYQDDYNFIVTCIDRGKLARIVKEEIKGVPIHVIGTHRGTKSSIILEANLLRFLQLWRFLAKREVDLGMSFGSFLIGAILTLKGTPNVHFCDDPERKINAILENLTCTERYLPPIVPEVGKVKTFNALKEWSYLSPAYFLPNNRVLLSYGVSPGEYVFIREVSTGSLNYINQKKNIIASVADRFDRKVPVLLSLEDKSTKDAYPEHWKILQEPVEDIHSLMYYSKLVISSGDSMAREGAMLGVPSVYCGFRQMKANDLLMKMGMLKKIEPSYLANTFNQLVAEPFNFNQQKDFRKKLEREWTDVNQLLKRIIDRHDLKQENKSKITF